MEKDYITSKGDSTNDAAFESTNERTRDLNSSQESDENSTNTLSPVGNSMPTVEELADEWIEFCRNFK